MTIIEPDEKIVNLPPDTILFFMQIPTVKKD